MKKTLTFIAFVLTVVFWSFASAAVYPYSDTFEQLTECISSYDNIVNPATVCSCDNIEETIQEVKDEFQSYAEREEFTDSVRYYNKRKAVDALYRLNFYVKNLCIPVFIKDKLENTKIFRLEAVDYIDTFMRAIK